MSFPHAVIFHPLSGLTFEIRIRWTRHLKNCFASFFIPLSNFAIGAGGGPSAEASISWMGKEAHGCVDHHIQSKTPHDSDS